MKNMKREVDKIINQPIINSVRHGNSFCPYAEYPRIVLYSPGKKKPGDYKLEFNGKIIYHTQIAQVINNLSTVYAFELVEFITNLYLDGLEATYSKSLPKEIMIVNETLDFEEFKYLIFFTILQEDINYPREEGKQGIKLPLCRFLEAAISGRQPDLITIEEIKIRINNHGKQVPKPLSSHKSLLPEFKKAFNLIK